MANLYVRSTDGSDADNGSTWALAKATVAGAAGIDAAGDVVYVSQAHSESTAGVTAAWAGTAASPVRIIGASDAVEPPTSLSTAPVVTVTGSTFSWTGAAYTYGLTFTFSTAGSTSPVFNGASGSAQVFDSCNFVVSGAGSSSTLQFGPTGSATNGYTELRGCTLKLGATGQRIVPNKPTRIIGGSWASGGTSPTGVFNFSSSRPSDLWVEGFDFSALSSSVNLVQGIADGGLRAIFRNCKLPASWSGALVASGQQKLGTRVEMHNCDSADTNYRLLIDDYAGTIRTETVIVRSGGASDGTTAFAWCMTTGANVAYPAGALLSPEVSAWNATVGSSITVTIEVITDGVTLTDAECWVEVQYLGTSGAPLALFARDVKADVLAAAANQTTSSATWTTTGLASPTKQQLSVSFTPQEAGHIQAVVRVAKASTTVYVDPYLTVT
jgi:hypothetical protein